MPRTQNKLLIGLAAAAASLAVFTQIGGGAMAAPAISLPAPAIDTPSHVKSETAVFAGGCFWGVQGVFQHVKGVTNAVSGYTGGVGSTAHYDNVSKGRTGHAESVRVTFDPSQVSYGNLLRIYFSVVADPTTLNYQGPDHGTQYRSALFPTTPQQKVIATNYIAQLGKSGAWTRPIVTKVENFGGFFPAEDYHQNYLTLNPDAGYIRVNDLPKVQALQQDFPTLYRATPVLVPGVS